MKEQQKTVIMGHCRIHINFGKIASYTNLSWFWELELSLKPAFWLDMTTWPSIETLRDIRLSNYDKIMNTKQQKTWTQGQMHRCLGFSFFFSPKQSVLVLKSFYEIPTEIFLVIFCWAMAYKTRTVWKRQKGNCNCGTIFKIPRSTQDMP